MEVASWSASGRRRRCRVRPSTMRGIVETVEVLAGVAAAMGAAEPEGVFEMGGDCVPPLRVVVARGRPRTSPSLDEGIRERLSHSQCAP